MDNLAQNVSKFIYNTVFYDKEFENIISQIIICYKLMKSDGCSLQNSENIIRNQIVNNYLMNKNIRTNITNDNYLFYRELPTKDDFGRVDIYVATQNTFKDPDAHYIIECKRLDNTNINGTTGLNAEYIKNGISRFISQKYSTYNNTAGMIGFVVEKMDIHKNIRAINELLEKHFTDINTKEALIHKTITPTFEYSYISKHRANNVLITIYHLMFDFSDNIVL
jgi:hypothetical protein